MQGNKGGPLQICLKGKTTFGGQLVFNKATDKVITSSLCTATPAVRVLNRAKTALLHILQSLLNFA